MDLRDARPRPGWTDWLLSILGFRSGGRGCGLWRFRRRRSLVPGWCATDWRAGDAIRPGAEDRLCGDAAGWHIVFEPAARPYHRRCCADVLRAFRSAARYSDGDNRAGTGRGLRSGTGEQRGTGHVANPYLHGDDFRQDHHRGRRDDHCSSGHGTLRPRRGALQPLAAGLSAGGSSIDPGGLEADALALPARKTRTARRLRPTCERSGPSWAPGVRSKRKRWLCCWLRSAFGLPTACITYLHPKSPWASLWRRYCRGSAYFVSNISSA